MIKTKQEAQALASEMKQKGFTFVGSNIDDPYVMAKERMPKGGYTAQFKKDKETKTARFLYENLHWWFKTNF